MKRLRRLAVIVAGIAVIALAAGFIGFARTAAQATLPADPRADAIVVLTGDSTRIERGLMLLAEGRGARLLISGVNPAVTERTMAAAFGSEYGIPLACCVDLGHMARDTIGNAAEARDWVARRHFTSLLVVTSDYHMRRSMAELAEAMPGVTLQAVPISNPAVDLADWWMHPGTFALLLREYGKYLLTVARLALVPWVP